MEQQNQNQNFFFERIKTLLTQPDTSAIIKGIAYSADDAPLSLTEYEVMGALAYTFGLDYLSQSNGFIKPVMTQVITRLELMKFEPEVITEFLKVIKNLDVELLSVPNESIKNRLGNVVKLNGKDFTEIRLLVTQIFRSSTTPITWAKDIQKLIDAREYTFEDLLKINSAIYQQITLDGDKLMIMQELWNNPNFSVAIKKATDYFDDQKFTLIYYDQIISLKEFQAANGDVDITKYFDKAELEKLPEVAEQKTITEEQKAELKKDADVIEAELSEKVEKGEYIGQDVPPEQTDRFILAILEDQGNRFIKNTADFDACFAELIKQTDLCQHVYSFAQQNMKTNRIPVEEVFPGWSETLHKHLNDEIAISTEVYKGLVERYTSPINPDKIQRVILLVNQVIKALVVTSGERKSIYVQQLVENQITTYKHLLDMVTFIEEEHIKGAELQRYVDLVDYIRTNEVVFTKLFEEVQEITPLSLRIDMLTKYKSFWFPVVKEEEQPQA